MRLHEIIQSLTTHEFGYITKKLRLEESQQSLALIQAVRKQEQPDQEALCAFIGCNKEVINSISKNAIEDIERLLRDYSKKKNNNFKLSNLFQTIEVYQRRGMYKQAFATAIKAKNAAEKYPKHPYPQLADYCLVKTAFLHMNLKPLQFNLKYIEEAALDTSQTIPNKTAYWILLIHALSNLRKNPLTNTQQTRRIKNIREVSKHPLLAHVNQAISREAKAIYYHTKATLSEIKGDLKQAKQYIEKALAILQSDKDVLINDDSALYVSVLNTLIKFYLINRNEAEANKYLKLLKGAPLTRDDSDGRILDRYYQNFIVLYGDIIKDYSVAIKAIKEAREVTNGELMCKERIYVMAAILSMYLQKYEDAKEYIDLLLKISFRKASNPYYIAINNILNLVCLYSLGEKEFVQTSTPATRILINRNGYIDDVSKMLLNFFNNANKYASKQEAKEAEIKLRDNILDYKKENGNKGFLCAFDVSLWLGNLINHEQDQNLSLSSVPS